MEKNAALRLNIGGTMGRKPDKRYFGRIWPNGNFSLATGSDGQAALEHEEESGENKARMPDLEAQREALASLTLSNALNSHTQCEPPPQRGLKGITGFGQQMLRSGCYLLERDYGKADMCFATLTVPHLPREGRIKLAENWSEVIRQFLQWVSRKLAAAGRPTKVCGCSEIQSSRLERSSEGYLHLHALWPSHSNAAARLWVVEWEELRDWWESALVRFSGCDLPYHPRVQTSPVEKGCEQYMGKYLSKGSGEHLKGFVADLGEESVPPAWWFMTSDLRRQIKSETARGGNTGELLYAVVQQALDEGDLGDFVWIRPVWLEYGDTTIHIGWCGRLAPRAREDMLSLLAPLLNWA